MDFKKGDRVSVKKAITNRVNNGPDILPTHVGVVTCGDKTTPTLCIDFGGEIGEIYWGRDRSDLKKVS